MIKWNTVIIIYNKTQLRQYLLEQISISIIKNIFHSCSKWTTSQGRVGLSETDVVVVVGGEFSLSSSSSSRIGFSAEPPISKSSNAVGEKGVSMPGLTTLLIWCVLCWLGITGTRARWLFKNYCLWDNNKLQDARGSSWELIVLSWTRFFKVRVTKSGPKSRDHSISSFETEKIMLL